MKSLKSAVFEQKTDDAKSNEWVSARELARHLGLSERTVLRRCQIGHFVSRKITHSGGYRYEIHVHSLPADLRYRLAIAITPTLAIEAPSAPVFDRDEELKLYMEVPRHSRVKADKYLGAFAHCNGYLGRELKRALDEWNAANPDMKVSLTAFYQKKKEYEEEGVISLLGKYGRNRNRSLAIEAWGALGDEAYRIFRASYLQDSRPTANACWSQAKGRIKMFLEQTDPSRLADLADEFPKVDAFLNRVMKEFGESGVYRARYGYDAWNRRYAPSIVRVDENVTAGRVWVSDHHQLDVIWIMEDGTLRRPWLTAWRDYKTGMFMSYTVSPDDPNANRVIDTFAAAVDKYGAPDAIIVDNGRDYRCFDFAGGRRKIRVDVDERRTRSMMQLLGIRAHFAWPYHGQSKPIERDFKTLIDGYARQMPGYTGNNSANRPESLKGAVKKRALMTWKEGIESLDMYIRDIMMRQQSAGKNLNGRSRAAAFEAEFPGNPRVSSDSLALLRMRTTERRLIRRNGIELDGHFWYSEWMEQFKSQRGPRAKYVYMRVPSDPTIEQAWVFDAETDELLGRAMCDVFTAPGLAVTEEEHAELSEAIRLKKQIEKSTAAALPDDALTHEEKLAAIAASIDHDDSVGMLIELNDDAVGRTLSMDAWAEGTGEVVLEAGSIISNSLYHIMYDRGVRRVRVTRLDNQHNINAMDHAIMRDKQMQKAGSYNYSETFPFAPEKKRFALFPSDLMASE